MNDKTLPNSVSWLRALLVPMLWMLATLWLTRGILSLWYAQRVSEANAWTHMLWEGLRFDGVLMGFYWILPAALTPWLMAFRWSRRGWSQALRIWGLLGVGAIVFMELATPAFISHYDSRPNYLFVEYLNYVQEVGTTLVKGYWPHLLVAAIVLPGTLWLYWRLTPVPATNAVRAPRVWQAALLSVVFFMALLVSGRGALGHRAANPAIAAVSADHLVNMLPLSSLYHVSYSIYQMRKSQRVIDLYGSTLSTDEALDRLRASAGLDKQAFSDPERPMRHQHKARMARERPLNLIIVLEESLGAEFVGSLGGLPLTPNLDRWAQQGLWFEQLYATGTRSVRGIEAVIAGYPPTTAVSTVKQAPAQRNFFTVASYLKPHGYESTFFYGGESHFDNMRSFFLGNGFDRVIEQKDMPGDAFIATWGASDEDVFRRAHQHFLEQPKDRPFFGLIFTSTNHEPFEFPQDRISLYEQPALTVNNAVKYADFTLGQFLDQARQSDYWKDTVILVVADHNSRVYGQSLFPVHRYHIPGLILGGPISPDRFTGVASQIDLAPTLFSLLGVSGPSPLMGRDLTDPAQRSRPGRALMQFNDRLAYMQGDQLVLLQAGEAPQFMQRQGNDVFPSPSTNPGLLEDAWAYTWYAQKAYRSGWHR